jgi:3-methyladenine DNA glycosylase AlkD
MAFARQLTSSGDWASRVVAWETLASHKGAMELLTDDLAEEMAEGLADWASVDLYGVTVLGQAWRDGTVTDSKINDWIKSDDFWKRRLALVATVPLNSRARGGRGDARRTLRVCRALRDDREDMVVKALSWALRELAKRDAAAVRKFLQAHEGRLAPRVRREVLNKLDTGLKSGSRKR